MLRTRLRQAIFSAPFSKRAAIPHPKATPFSSYQNLFQQRNYNGGWRYQRFQQSRAGLKAWAARPTFYYEVGGIAALAGGFYVYNLETVPVTGRRRFMIATDSMEKALADHSRREVLQEFRDRILPAHDPRAQRVHRVAERLIPYTGMTGLQWEVFVIESEEMNAFVTPGGQIFVFTGILPICGDEDGLAAVIGHEIGHKVARHMKERLSRSYVLWLVAVIGEYGFGIPGQFSNGILDLVLNLPNGRSHELEADYIGLLMMAQACYNPEAALRMWQRMDYMEKESGVSVPQFISTHPSHVNRQEEIREWLPAAQMKAEQSECHQMTEFKQFRRGYSGV